MGPLKSALNLCLYAVAEGIEEPNVEDMIVSSAIGSFRREIGSAAVEASASATAFAVLDDCEDEEDVEARSVANDAGVGDDLTDEEGGVSMISSSTTFRKKQ